MEPGHAHAPVLQGLWERVRGTQQEVLLAPHLTASCAFLTHVLLCAPFLALDALGRVCARVRSWRVAAGSGPPPPLGRWFECFCRLLFRYTTAVAPAAALLQLLRSPRVPELAPTCWQLCVEVAACLLLFDTLFFLWHYVIHR